MNYQFVFFFYKNVSNVCLGKNAWKIFTKSKLDFTFLVYFIFFLQNSNLTTLKYNYVNTNVINSKYIYFFFNFFLSKHFFLSNNWFFSKELTLKVRSMYIKRYINRFKKIKYKKWPKSSKKFLKKKLKRKYKYIVYSYRLKKTNANVSQYLFFFLNSILSISKLKKTKLRILFRVTQKLFYNYNFLLNNFLNQSFLFFFNLNFYTFKVIKKNFINFSWLVFFKKTNNLNFELLFDYKDYKLNTLKFLKKLTPTIYITNLKIVNFIFFDNFFFKNFLVKFDSIEKFILKKKIHKFRKKKSKSFINHKIIFQKFLKNFILNADFSKILIFNFSSSYLHLFFFKYFSIKKLTPRLSTNLKIELFNNLLPLNYFTKPLRRLIFSKFQKSYTPDFYKYIYFYIVNFLEFFTKSNVFVRLQTKIKIPATAHIELYRIFFKHKSFQAKIGRGFFFFEMLEILWLSFFYKDLNFLMDWFIKTMERIPFKKHKKLLSTFKFIIVHYNIFLLETNNVKGFFFDIRGKVGVSGNAKKRHFSFYSGKYSKTTKNSKFDYQHNIVKTFTGALGVTMILFY